MLEKLGAKFADGVERWLPDSLVFAFILTIVAFLLALGLTPTTAAQAIEGWYKGFWLMLEFAMQMALILTLGYCIGKSQPVAKLFDKLAGLIKTPTSAYLVMSLVSLVLITINWGLAPVAGLFAYEVSKRVKGIDYRMACAAVYVGLIPWHGGLSASAPLLMNTPDNVFIQKGLVEGVIPTSLTLGSTVNIVLLLASFILIPIFILLMAPKKPDERFDTTPIAEGAAVADAAIAGVAPQRRISASPADLMENSWLLNLIIVLAGFIVIIPYFAKTGLNGLNLNSINFLFLMLGLALHYTPRNYINAMKEAVSGIGDILLQFPFYAGIMGIFMFCGVSDVIAKWFASFASAVTFPWFAFLTSAIVNLFIPSGGGEWMVLGPSLLKAAQVTGASVGKTIIAFAYGDALTNLINPFWTLAFLPVMGKLMNIRPRDFMGYAVLMCLIFFVIISVILLLVP